MSCLQKMKLGGVCCLALFPPLLWAQYQRVGYSGKGETHDVSSSHPLIYWTADPLERDDGGELCLGCRLAGGHTVGKQDYKVTTDVHHLGVLGGCEIIEVIYQGQGNVFVEGQTFLWKILLVGAKAGQFAEIYHLQTSGAFTGPLSPARIVTVTGERILATNDSDGGNGGGCWDGYWWFDKVGPHEVDFNPVYKAIAEHTPKGSTFTERCWTINLDNAEINTDVRTSSAECRACGQLGTATAEFEFHHGVAKATEVNFASDPVE